MRSVNGLFARKELPRDPVPLAVASGVPVRGEDFGPGCAQRTTFTHTRCMCWSSRSANGLPKGGLVGVAFGLPGRPGARLPIVAKSIGVPRLAVPG